MKSLSILKPVERMRDLQLLILLLNPEYLVILSQFFNCKLQLMISLVISFSISSFCEVYILPSLSYLILLQDTYLSPYTLITKSLASTSSVITLSFLFNSSKFSGRVKHSLNSLMTISK